MFPFVCSVECLVALVFGAILTFYFFLASFHVHHRRLLKSKIKTHTHKQERISTVSCSWWPHPWFQLCLFSITTIAILTLTRWHHGYKLYSVKRKLIQLNFLFQKNTNIATIIIAIGPNGVPALAALGAADEQADRQGRSKAGSRASGQQQADERH